LTPGFAPLEQYAEQAKRGAYTDIYALGATLYYLLTGEVPVSATDRASGIRLRSVREINPMVSERVEKAVMKAMAMRVEERPQSVKEFVRLLTSPSAGVATSVSSISKLSATLVSRQVSKKFITVVMATFSIFCLLCILRYVENAKYDLITTLEVGEKPDSVSFSPDGKFLAATISDAVKVWKVGSWREVITLRGKSWILRRKIWREDLGWYEITGTIREWYAKSVAFSPDSKFLASIVQQPVKFIVTEGGVLITDEIELVKIWETRDWREIVTLQVYGDNISMRLVTFSPNNKFLAALYCKYDKGISGIKIWEVGSWREIVNLWYPPAPDIDSIAFSYDNKFLALGVESGVVKVLEVGSWREVVTLFIGFIGDVESITFSSDGRFLAVRVENKVIVWKVGSWYKIAEFLSGGELLVFSPNNKFLISGADVWEVEGWRKIMTLWLKAPYGKFAVGSGALSPDGKFLASGDKFYESERDSLRIWRVREKIW
jgi:WD40 repeat protein